MFHHIKCIKSIELFSNRPSLRSWAWDYKSYIRLQGKLDKWRARMREKEREKANLSMYSYYFHFIRKISLVETHTQSILNYPEMKWSDRNNFIKNQIRISITAVTVVTSLPCTHSPGETQSVDDWCIRIIYTLHIAVYSPCVWRLQTHKYTQVHYDGMWKSKRERPTKPQTENNNNTWKVTSIKTSAH